MMVLFSEENELILRSSEHVPEVVKQVLTERGWNEYDDSNDAANVKSMRWNLWWKSQRFRKSDHDEVAPWQRLNHFPRTDAITRKDSLVRNLRRMRCIHGAQMFNFHPNAYILPNEYIKFVSDYTKELQKYGKKNLFWICKPVDLSRGRGIFVFQDLKHLTYDCSVIVQRYISNPLLISGYKFDLRIYVCVPSFQPLNIYMYQEGIVRFGTDKFDLNQLGNVFSHLTNTSINKFGPSFATDKERVGSGCKWTLSQFRSYLRQLDGFDESLLWLRISNIITLTLATQAPSVPKCNNCFEVFGFDIIIDDTMKPWLLEVNFSPALSIDCQADFIAKRSMLNDLIDLLNFKESDSEHGGDIFCSRTPSTTRSLYERPHSRTLKTHAYLKSSEQDRLGKRKPLSVGKKVQENVNTVNKQGSKKDEFPQNSSSSSLASNVSSIDNCNQPENFQNEPSKSKPTVKIKPTATKKQFQKCNGKQNPSSIITEATTKSDKKIEKEHDDILFKQVIPAIKGGSTKPALKKKVLCSAPLVRKTKVVNDHHVRKSSSNILSYLQQSNTSTKRSEYNSPYSILNTITRTTLKSNPWPRTRVGDFILTFPFNEASRKSSGSNYDMKIIIKEQQKLIKKVMSNYPKRSEKARKSSTCLSRSEAIQLNFQLRFNEKQVNPLYFWGPQNSPLLCDILT